MGLKKDKSSEKLCAAHILIPSEDPQNRVTKKQINDAVSKIKADLEKDPQLFGVAAYQLSADPSGRYNKNLKECILSIDENDPSKQEKQIDCVKQYGGDLGCFDESEVITDFAKGVSKLKPGQIGIVDTKFGHHIVRRYTL